MATYRDCREAANKLRAQAADQLEFADWLETEGVKLGKYDLPYFAEVRSFSVHLTNNESYQDDEGLWQTKLNEVKTKAAIRRFLDAVGTCEKEFVDESLKIVKKFGNTIRLIGFVDRSIACKKIVKERKWVPEYVSKGHYEDVAEWDCETPSLIALVKE